MTESGEQVLLFVGSAGRTEAVASLGDLKFEISDWRFQRRGGGRETNRLRDEETKRPRD
jgi:hypothetical protein